MNPSQVESPLLGPVLFFKLLQAANSTPSNLGQLFTFRIWKVGGGGELQEDKFLELEVKGGAKAGLGNAPQMGLPWKARLLEASPSPRHSHHAVPGLPAARAQPRELASVQPSPLRSTHSLFGIPH